MILLNNILIVLVSFAWSDSSIKIDSSGADGKHAEHGYSYSTSPGSSSSNGRNGGDATKSSSGSHAKDIILNLSSSNKDKVSYIKISGSIAQSGPLDKVITLDSSSEIVVDASGGEGGNGGSGGNGEGGCNGSNGASATRSSRGKNGGSGCSGGDSGRPSPGSDGGDAAFVKVHIPIDDIHLSLLMQCDVSSGAGGDSSIHGLAGSGGSGGAGGSSYSWRVKTGQSCSSTSVSNGNGSYSTKRTCVDTYTTKSNPGGSRGAKGPDGKVLNGDTSGGDDGSDGLCTFITKDGQKVIKGSNPFKFQVESYTMYDENQDGIYEPLEKFYIKDITVKNNGDLPSPVNKADFNLFFKNTAYTSPVSKIVTLPRVYPGESFKVSETFEFTVNDNHEMGIDQRLRFEDSISPKNIVTHVERPQKDFENIKHFVITYPIEISSFTLQESVGAGEKIPIFWKIKNNSNLDFGGEKALRRIVSELYISAGDADPGLFSFSSEDEQVSVLSDVKLLEILNLKAKQELLIEGQISVNSNALPYTSSEFSSSLTLENLAGEMRKIQKDSLSLRISQLYSYNPESEFLLITHSKTQRQEFLAWRAFGKSLQSSIDVWDFSYYGALSFSKGIKELGDSSFSQILKDKTIILLNNAQHEASETFALSEVAKQLSKRKSNLVVVGGDKEDLKNQMKALLSVPLSEDYALSNDELKKYFWRWKTPKVKDIDTIVLKTSNKLQESDPKLRYFIKFEYQPELIKKGLFTNAYDLGSIMYANTLTPGGGRAAFLPLTQEEMSTDTYIKTEELVRATILVTSFKYKLKTLNSTPDAFFRVYLRDAILYDLILELDLMDSICSIEKCDVDTGLNRVNSFINYIDTIKSEDEYIISAVYLYAKVLENSSIKKSLKKKLKPFMKEHAVDDMFNEVKDFAKERRQTLVGISKRENYRNMFTYPALFRVLTTDEVLNLDNVIKD